ncbi:MAG: hypothetical protein NVS3B23_08800 [Candidatus Saccharimonadales bacterium]
MQNMNLSHSNFECLITCPYRDTNSAAVLRALCRGVRVRLDTVKVGTSDDYIIPDNLCDGTYITEETEFACGSTASADKSLPSISLVDWKNTRVPAAKLKNLYDLGLLPDQLR